MIPNKEKTANTTIKSLQSTVLYILSSLNSIVSINYINTEQNKLGNNYKCALHFLLYVVCRCKGRVYQVKCSLFYLWVGPTPPFSKHQGL